MPRLHRELIRQIIESDPEIEVVCEVTEDGRPIRQVIEDARAEVIIIGSEAKELLADCRGLLGELAPRRVIAVSEDAREAQLYGVVPYETLVEELSPASVVEAVRNS
jgi:chemotaxis response regulator CheB